MLKTIFIVGTGGFLGSVGRYLTELLVERYLHSSFPWGTFLANVVGCIVIGLVYAFSERGNLLTPEWRLFMAVGFCGGFTTFSAFAYNNLSMLTENNLLQFLGNVSLNVIVGTGAVYIGIVAVRLIYSA